VTRLLFVLGKEANAVSVLKKAAKKTRQAGKPGEGELSVASTYYHPLDPLRNRIDHLAVVDFGCTMLYGRMIALAGKPVKTYRMKGH
jgi:hypothetical protein